MIDYGRLPCPSAPIEPHVPMSLAFQGLILNEEIAAREHVEIGGAEKETEEGMRPEIRLITRAESHGHLNADDYSKDRTGAMQKTQSSRYHMFKYNFGGYIPSLLRSQKRRNKHQTLTIGDYKRFLRCIACDYIHTKMLDDDEAQKELQRMIQEQDRMLTAVRERMIMEAERRLRVEEKGKMQAYDPDTWNVGVLRYMDELSRHERVAPGPDIFTLDSDTNLDDTSPRAVSMSAKLGVVVSHADMSRSGVAGVETTSSYNIAKSSYDLGKSGYDLFKSKLSSNTTGVNFESESTRPASFPRSAAGRIETGASASLSIPHPRTPRHSLYDDNGFDEEEAEDTMVPLRAELKGVFSSETNLNISDTQIKLEALWVSLRMPSDQKLDMAVKYSNPLFTSHIQRAIELWTSASDLICERESVLRKIEKFERSGSDPA